MTLAIQFANGLGNFVQLTPALRAIRETLPDERIELVITTNPDEPQRWAQLVELARCYVGRLVDEVHAIDRTLPVDLSPWDRCVTFQHGEDNPWRRAMIQCGSIHIPATQSWHLHEVEHYMEAAYQLGYRGPVPDLLPPYEMKCGTRSGVGLCNGSSAHPLFARKKWPTDRWPVLARTLHGWTGEDVIGFAGPGDTEMRDALVSAGLTVAPPDRMPWCMTISGLGAHLENVCAWLSGLRYLVTTDTFLMHLAASLGTPIMALFGPTIVRKNAPWRAVVEYVRPELACSPCQGGPNWPTCQQARCMEQIEVGDVMAAVRRLERRLSSRRMAA